MACNRVCRTLRRICGRRRAASDSALPVLVDLEGGAATAPGSAPLLHDETSLVTNSFSAASGTSLQPVVKNGVGAEVSPTHDQASSPEEEVDPAKLHEETLQVGAGISNSDGLGGATEVDVNSKLKDISMLYLDKLGHEERARLIEFRRHMPEICRRVHSRLSEKALQRPRLTFWGVDMEEPGDATDIVLLKHLRAEGGCLDKAIDRLADTFVFRAEERIDELAEQTLADVGARFATAGMFGGTDRVGRPVVVATTPKGQDAESLLSDVPGFVRFNFWLKEQAFKRIRFERGAPEDMCQIVDLSTAKFGPPPKAVQESSKVFKKYCPETNGVNIFVNVPAVVVGVFKLCKTFIDPRTFEKIRIIGKGEPLKLYEYVSPESLPICLGGVLQQPPGPLQSPCKVVEVMAGTTAEVTLLEVSEPCDICWELRVVAQTIGFQVTFAAAGSNSTLEAEVNVSGDEQQLDDTSQKWTNGVASGNWRAPTAGELKCRLSSEFARFGARARAKVCLCRAEIAPRAGNA